MNLRCSSANRAILTTIAGALLCCSSGFGQSSPKPTASGSTIKVFVDGLTCGAAPESTFDAQSFHLAVTDAVSTGVAGVGKVVFGDLSISKLSDSCSLPLLLVTSSGKSVKRVTLTEVDKTGKPVLTINLENALITLSEVKGADAGDSAEQLEVSYASITVTDAAGVTTGRITR